MLGDSLVANGEEQTQQIKSVTVTAGKGAEAKVLDVTYTVSGNVGTEPGTYTLTVTATGNYTGTCTKKFVILTAPEAEPEINEKGEVVIGNGTISAPHLPAPLLPDAPRSPAAD